MSEEESLAEEERDVKLLEIVQALSELGENKVANQLFKELEKKITFAEREDWINEQICSVFPNNIDIRCLVFCCSPSNNCPYRTAVLKKIGLTTSDYIEMKKELAEQLEKYVEGKNRWEK